MIINEKNYLCKNTKTMREFGAMHFVKLLLKEKIDKKNIFLYQKNHIPINLKI